MAKKSIQDETKWLIVSYFKQKHNYKTIARLCGVSRTCVRTTIRNYIKFGTIKDRYRSGRPRVSTKRDDNMLFRIVRKYPKMSLRNLKARWLLSGSNVSSISTISRRLIEFGLDSYDATKKPLLSDRDRRARMNWCKRYVNWSYAEWSKVIFSDESNFQLVNRKTKIKVRRFSSEKYATRFVQPRLQAGGGSVGIWGCFSASGVGLNMMYSNRMNQHAYLDVLENRLIPSRDLLVHDHNDWYYQHDNAPCHKAGSITKWLNENSISVISWPARSPDLNPIENIWAIIDRKLANHTISNLRELEQLVDKYWNEVGVELCVKLIESMPARIKACLKSKGGYFKY